MTDRCIIDAIKAYSLVAITGTIILLPIKSSDMNSWRAGTRRCIFKRVLGTCEFINGFSIFKWWRHQMETFSRYWPFVRGIHRSPVNSPHKGQWSGALMFSLICAWINGWAKNCNAGDLGRHHAHYDVTIMKQLDLIGHQASSPINDRQVICHIAPRVCAPPVPQADYETTMIIPRVQRETQRSCESLPFWPLQRVFLLFLLPFSKGKQPQRS